MFISPCQPTVGSGVNRGGSYLDHLSGVELAPKLVGLLYLVLAGGSYLGEDELTC